MGILSQLAFCNTFCRLKAAAKLASLCQTGYKVRFNVMAEHLMSDVPFWQSKTLDEMSDAEWESLCDGCGQCCLHKLMDEDTDEIYFTNVACRQLNIKTCQCRNYERRFEFEPDCIKLTRENLPTFEWLPMTCAYRLLAEGKGLPAWHPLLTGSKAAMHGERISVRHIAVKESEVIDWQDHILNKPDWAQ